MTINVTKDEFWEIIYAIRERCTKLSGEMVENPYDEDNLEKSKERLWLKEVERKMANILNKGANYDE